MVRSSFQNFSVRFDCNNTIQDNNTTDISLFLNVYIYVLYSM